MKRQYALRWMAVLGLGALIMFGTTGCICMLPHLFGHGSDAHSGKTDREEKEINTSSTPHVHDPASGNEL